MIFTRRQSFIGWAYRFNHVQSVHTFVKHTNLIAKSDNCISLALCGAAFVLHIPIIKYIFEIYLDIHNMYCRRQKWKRLKTVQLSTALVTLLYSILLDNLPVKDSILLDSLVCIRKLNSKSFLSFKYFNISVLQYY